MSGGRGEGARGGERGWGVSGVLNGMCSYLNRQWGGGGRGGEGQILEEAQLSIYEG